MFLWGPISPSPTLRFSEPSESHLELKSQGPGELASWEKLPRVRMTCRYGECAPGPPGPAGFLPASSFLILKFVPSPGSPASHLSPISFHLSTVTRLDPRPDGPPPLPQASQAWGMEPKLLSMGFKILGDLHVPNHVTPDPPGSLISFSPSPAP